MDLREVLTRARARGLYTGAVTAAASTRDADNGLMALFREQHVPGAEWSAWKTPQRIIAAEQLL